MAIARAHEEFKDKEYQLELSIISNFQEGHQILKRKEREPFQREADRKVEDE